MRTCIMIATSMLLVSTVTAQTQKNTSDTVRIGNFVIVKKKNDEGTQILNEKKNITINLDKNSSVRKKKNISTNWWILDLGLANFQDNTNYAAAQAGGYLRNIAPGGAVNANSFELRTGKTTNVNLWFFMQKLNVAKHVVNLKYGMGLEMYNFRFQRSLSYRKDPTDFAFVDSIGFSKNKLYAGYLTVPFMININPTPNNRNGFSFSAGVSAGYLIGARNKQVSDARGKQKINGDFDLNPWRIAAIGEVGLGPVRLYGTYSLNTLHKESTRLEQTPYAVGIRFSRW